ncbi:unnamed protein product [Mytilus edulis]|uniref:B box-type domain-containing protein n=1 Tax=Mytilus edulis TaxID=6550 RepID=A0A8S3PSG8_MYTED|nr:unnamed protein product [Mytilus edulis]
MEKVQCEPCKVRNRNNVSIHWCVICEESLCSDCTENHRSMKISRNHELIDINRMPIQTNIADQCCFKHDNLPFEYFCIDHDVLSCKECLAESHRSCQKVMSVDIACKGAKQSQSFIDATELVDHVLETTHTIGKDEQDFIENIAKEANSVKTAVRIVKEEAIRHIEALEKSLRHDLDLKKDKIIQKSKTTIKETEDIKKSTKDKQDIFDLVNKHGSEKQAFIAVHAYKQDLTDLEKRVTGITEKSTRFTINLNPQKLKESIHSIGSIELSEVPSNVKFVQKKKCQSQMPIVQAQSMPQFVYKQDLDTKNVEIYGMTINDNNEVILVDNSGLGRILVYDENDNYKYQIETKHQPWDIALIPGKNSGVMTSYFQDVLEFVDFDKKNISRTVLIRESGQGGVAASNKNIYVGTKGNINILDLEGRFIRSIKTKNEKVKPWFMTLDKSENIYYTGYKILCCIRSDGTEVYTYSTPDNDNLWNLAVDNHGYVYVAVQESGVYRIKPDGKLMDIVIKNENHLESVGICFNIQFTKMILSRGDTISVFNQK